ncbi:MAG: hypothetical protein AB1414_01300 [bacterium]
MAKKDFSNLKRNWDKIQFEKLRKRIDKKFNDIHDELSDCYYNKKPFKNYGILTKEKFDKLHSLIFLERDIKFHEENIKQPERDRIPEEQYNEISIKDEKGKIIKKEKRSKNAQKIINQLKKEKINLIIK